MEIEPARAGGGIVERLAYGGEVGKTARLRAFGRRRHERIGRNHVGIGHRGCDIPRKGPRGNKHVIFLSHVSVREPYVV